MPVFTCKPVHGHNTLSHSITVILESLLIKAALAVITIILILSVTLQSLVNFAWCL